MSRASIRALIMAGGTGGHVMPALAIAERLRELGHAADWLGTDQGIEARLVPAAGIRLHRIRMSGLRGKGWLRLLAAPFQLLSATCQAVGVIRRSAPDVVLGMGGYVAAPGGLAARLMRKPLVIHEQNATAGLTNRVLAKLAQRVLLGFDGALHGGDTVGNPVRAAFAALPAPAERYAQRSGAIRVLVVGGSQGARALNEWVPRVLATLPRQLLVRHQGGRTVEVAEHAYAEAGVEARIEAFIDDMPEAYAWADLVICRAGAMTVAELAASGCAALFVPFPAAVDDHQTTNASALVAAGAAELIQERDIRIDSLGPLLARLTADRAVLAAMADRARAFSRPDAARRITDICVELAA